MVRLRVQHNLRRVAGDFVPTGKWQALFRPTVETNWREVNVIDSVNRVWSNPTKVHPLDPRSAKKSDLADILSWPPARPSLPNEHLPDSVKRAGSGPLRSGGVDGAEQQSSQQGNNC